MNLILNPGFEWSDYWTLMQLTPVCANILKDRTRSRSGQQFLELWARSATKEGAARFKFNTRIGSTYRVWAWAKKEWPGASLLLQVLDSGDGTKLIKRVNDNDATGDWQLFQGSFTAQGPTADLKLATDFTSGDPGVWVGDDVGAMEVGTSILPPFLQNLAHLIEKSDLNAGLCFNGPVRWNTLKELEDAAAIALIAGGDLDYYTLEGRKVVRFWEINTNTSRKRNTNKTNELKHEILVRAFFQYAEGESQGTALKNAVEKVLSSITDQEHLSLAAGLDDSGYEGFLETPPEMATPVQPARIGESEIQGYSAELSITCFEEVPI